MNKPLIQPPMIRCVDNINTIEEAITIAGSLLIKEGYVNSLYIASMLARENELSTYVGHGIVLPHGLDEDRDQVIKPGISIVQLPQGVDYNGHKCYLVIGLATTSSNHLKILSGVARMLHDEHIRKILKTSTNKDEIVALFSSL